MSVIMQIDDGCVGLANMLALRDCCFVVIGVGAACPLFCDVYYRVAQSS